MPALLRGQALRFPATAPAARCVCEGGGAGRNWRAPHASLLAHAQKKKKKLSRLSLVLSLSIQPHSARAAKPRAIVCEAATEGESPERGAESVRIERRRKKVKGSASPSIDRPRPPWPRAPSDLPLTRPLFLTPTVHSATTRVARNPNFAKLQAGYLFPEIARRRRAHAEARSDAKIISLGIGDTTEPIPPTIAKAMADAAAGLGTLDGYSG